MPGICGVQARFKGGRLAETALVSFTRLFLVSCVVQVRCMAKLPPRRRCGSALCTGLPDVCPRRHIWPIIGCQACFRLWAMWNDVGKSRIKCGHAQAG